MQSRDSRLCIAFGLTEDLQGMRAKLSARSIQTLRPGDKPFEVVDAGLKGFLLRVQPSGAMAYYFSYRNEHGRRKRYRIGNSESLSPAQARDQAIVLSARVVAGEDIQETKKRERQVAKFAMSQTLEGFLIHNYEPWATSQRKSGPATVKRIRSNFDHLMHRPLNDINLWVIEKWRSEQIIRDIKRKTRKQYGAEEKHTYRTGRIHRDAVPYHCKSIFLLAEARQSRANPIKLVG